MTTVLIRADAGETIGLGHVMRCLAIAEALIEARARVVFALSAGPESLIAALTCRIAAAGADVTHLSVTVSGAEDLEATLAAMMAIGAGAVILDGYRFDEAWRAALRARGGAPVVALDDTGELTALHADIVVNPAPSGETMGYAAKAPGAAILTGPRFALLRREFREAARSPAPPFEARDRVLITFGGSDPAGLTGPCAVGLFEAMPENVRFDVVVGGGNPRIEATRALMAVLGSRATLHVDTRRMSELMTTAGMAVSAAGGTTGELAALGVPTVLVVVADNQAPAAASVGSGFVVADGRGAVAEAAREVAARAASLWNDLPRRAAMRAAMMGVVDGLGAVRVADAIIARIAGPPAPRAP